MSTATQTPQSPPRTQPTRRRRRERFLYFAPNDLLVPRVDRQCTMRFCDAMLRAGVDTRIVSLNVRLDYAEPTKTRSLAAVYGTSSDLEVAVLPCISRQTRTTRWHSIWRTVAYTAYASHWLLRNARRDGERPVFYFKNYLLGLSFLALRRLASRRVLLVFEIHTPPDRPLERALLRRFDGIVSISEALARRIAVECKLDLHRVQVAHQGVDLQRVEKLRMSKTTARRSLGLPLEKRLVIYTGKVHSSSDEIRLLIAAVGELPHDVELVIVGGREDHVANLRRQTNSSADDRVRFTGFVAPVDAFTYQWAADVLVSYYPSSLSLNQYRSPGKLFEYMAAERPIVLADYEAMHEILTEDDAVYVRPDDSRELARALKRVLEDQCLARSLAANALVRASNFTWDRRAERILDLVRRLRPAIQEIDQWD